jgi:mannose-1-phosphate guanylyltransferase
VVEAILLVGGLGTRLRPLTEHVPKPMLPVAGVPFVAHQVARAAAAGVRRVVLATSYRAEAFEAYVPELSQYGVEVELMLESTPLGTAGAIRNAAQMLGSGPDDPVVVFNGDVLDGHDLRAQLARHAEWDADVTLYLTEVEDPRAFGSVLIGADGRVSEFLEKSPEPVTNRVNAGCYVFRRAVLDSIPEGRPVSVERETFPDLLRTGRTVLGHVDRAYWTDLGTPALYVQGSADLVRGVIVPSARPGLPGESLVMPGATVHPTARVYGGSSVLPGAVVGPDCVVEGSVVMADAVIGAGSRVRRSAIGQAAEVAGDVLVETSVIGAGARIGTGNEIRHGARVAAHLELPPHALRF